VTFEEFLDAQLPELGRFAGSLVGDSHLAEDVLSDALVKVARRWRKVSAAENPAAYVRRIVVTTYLSDRRDHQRRRTTPTSDPQVLDRPLADATDSVIARDEIARLIEQLPPQQRAAVVMRYVLDEPDDQIAVALGCTPATVRSHLAHARAALRLTAGREPSTMESAKE
jgi:RNA polymerase sigma-70 factor (sigma-E family)